MSSLMITPAKLFSELCIVHLKLYHQMILAYDPEVSDEEVGQVKKIICKLNTRRTNLENEIDANFKSWLAGQDLYPFDPVFKDYSSRKK